eukprot:CAMPEP_0206602224 /NCGR_PEP_ID=MMETSP0325_2-20121206/47244_1 /ASSEMBLY_ACC=CAM_ASM_000347 /TAXON_ID=2866 /ORGANISM="Crypthecodinium cohnii, Strain Seligo" /LENGTH=618 /DNA_ID=CAMNT_0054114639 /DNA_START=132 /DNA_END=1988 /DNA_ORIENTATION=+
MGGASSWYSILSISAFLVSIWIASKVSRTIGISSIVLEISVGLILSPNALDFLPHEYSVCYAETITDCETHHEKLEIAEEGVDHCDLQAYLDAGKYASSWQDGFFGESSVTIKGHTYDLTEAGSSDRRLALGRPVLPPAPQRRLSTDSAEGKVDYDNYEQCLLKRCELELANECAHTPNILTLIGHTGVAMMIFESGMHFDFEQAKSVGGKACIVAVCGTVLPLVTGCLLVMAYGYDFSNGFAAGTALAPTSVGIALRLLHEAHALQTYFGQAIITAAFVDDILSLILYNVLFSINDEFTFMTFLPMLLGLIFMSAAAAAGATLWPKLISWALSKIPETKAETKLTLHHELLFLLMVTVLIAYAQITHLCGTHLWGCFIAGMSFAMWKEAHHVWVRQTKRMTSWMIRIFFSATVAFSIPIEDLLSMEAFLKGTLLGIGPCILSKVLCAPFMGDSRFVIGWAMVGRAEFAYLIGQMAAASGLMDAKVFSIVIWALLYATVFAPFIFRVVLNRYVKKNFSEDDVVRAGTNGSLGGEAIEHWQRSTLASGHLPDLVEEQKKMDDVQEQEEGKHAVEDNLLLKGRLQALEVSEASLKCRIQELQEATTKNFKQSPKETVFGL